MATATEVMATNSNEFYEQLKIIGHILQDVSISDHRMTAVDFVDVDSGTPTFNEWFDTCETIVTYDVNEEREEDDDDIQYRTKIHPKTYRSTGTDAKTSVVFFYRATTITLFNL